MPDRIIVISWDQENSNKKITTDECNRWMNRDKGGNHINKIEEEPYNIYIQRIK